MFFLKEKSLQKTLIFATLCLLAVTVVAISYIQLEQKYEKLQTEYAYSIDLTKFFMDLKDPEHKSIKLQSPDKSI